MKNSYIFLCSSAVAALICGLSPHVIAVSSLAASLTAWIRFLTNNMSGESLAVINDPKAHNPEIIANALETAAKKIIKERKPANLLISNPGINSLKLMRNESGELILSDSHRSLTIENGEVWIADHPLPFIFEAQRNAQLHFTPAEGERIRVSLKRKSFHLKYLIPLTPIIVLLLYLDLNIAAAALTAPALYILTEEWLDR